MEGLKKPTSHASFFGKLLEDVLQQNNVLKKRQTGVPGNKGWCNSKKVKGSLEMTSVQKA